MKRFKLSLSALLVLPALVLALPSASAKTCEDITLPDSVTVAGKKLVLNGMGIREATVFKVDVYIAGLYVEAKSRSGADIMNAEGPRQLVLRFVRDVDKEDIVEAFSEGFTHSGKFGALKAKISQLLGMMVEAKDGKTWTFTYDPAKGLEVKLAGSVKGTIEGGEFFSAFLNIWLGSKPPNSGLKRGLLGGKCG